MVPISRIENFIRRAVWRLTRSSDIIKYVPKSIHNGVVVGDCAVLRNKMHTFDVYSKNRKPIKKNVCNHKIAICIATLMNQYNINHQVKLKQLAQLDSEYAICLGRYHNIKTKIQQNPHLESELDEIAGKVMDLSDKIEAEYTAMTL